MTKPETRMDEKGEASDFDAPFVRLFDDGIKKASPLEGSQEPEDYWRHGHSTESDFIYVTTQSLPMTR